MMTTTAAGALFAERFQQLKQIHSTPTIYEPKEITSFVIRPVGESWEDLQKKLDKVVNLPGFMDSRVRELFDQGYGAELETAAEIALSTAKKSPYNLFAAMISKKAGNWRTKTLQMVQATWEARRHTVEVMDRLKLKAECFKPVLSLAWRLNSVIMRYLGMATEKGTGIKNPAGLFFWLTKRHLGTN